MEEILGDTLDNVNDKKSLNEVYADPDVFFKVYYTISETMT